MTGITDKIVGMSTTTTKRAFKYRFHPTAQQAELLQRTFGCVRLVYNLALEARSQAWKNSKQRVGLSETSSMLTAWKQQPELAFLNEVSSVPLQQVLRHLQKGFVNFWRKTSRYPRFKSKRTARKSAEFTRSAFSWRDGQLTLAKTSDPLDIVWSRPLPEASTPSSVTISQDAARRWYVSILVEDVIEHHQPAITAVGVDLGLTHLATLSTGEKINNPRTLARHARKLARAQRALARKQKGSKNRAKARHEVARIHARIVDARRDHLHKLSSTMIRENQTVVVEDLNTTGMSARGGSRKHGLNRSIQDASWHELRTMLEYKAAWYGRELIVIDRWYPSSQICSTCGHRGTKLPLSVRAWQCSSCHTLHDRDINAAKNILAAGLAVNACGDGISLEPAA